MMRSEEKGCGGRFLEGKEIRIEQNSDAGDDEPEEDEPEELFRQAFSLTHYRLDFVRSRQLLERLLSLQPHHVPALTTLVATRPHTHAALFGLHHA